MTFVEKVCVLGAGSTKYGKLADSIADITTQASVAAIKSAGIEPKEIGASYISNVFGIADKQVHIGPVLMSRLGIPDKPSLTIESACGSGSVSFREAYANIAAGFYDCLIATGVRKKLLTLELNGQQHTLHIVPTFSMKDKLVHHFQDYLHQWQELT